MVCLEEIYFIVSFFHYFKAKHLIQIVILGSQVIGRAFTRALRQELQCMNEFVFFSLVFIL